jgi:hypothetical protein
MDKTSFVEITIYESSLREISLTSKRIFEEFLITPAGKRSLISPPSSSSYQHSFSSFSVLIGSTTGDESGDDEQDAAGDVEGSILGTLHSSSLSLFNLDFLRERERVSWEWEKGLSWSYRFFFIFIGAHPRFWISLKRSKS